MLDNTQIKELERQAIVAALFKICDPRGMENINKGDTVQLKSGGPIMTVNDISSGGTVTCQWFDKDGALKVGHFQGPQLKKADPEQDAYIGG